MEQDGKIIHSVRRRMRCEASQSCKKIATRVIGMKGVELPICDEHFQMVVKEVYKHTYELGLEQKKAAEEPKEEVKVEAEVKETPKEVAPEVEQPEGPKEEKAHEYYTCKYCGEKFDKEEMTSGQFMAHCRKCKKEHE